MPLIDRYPLTTREYRVAQRRLIAILQDERTYYAGLRRSVAALLQQERSLSLGMIADLTGATVDMIDGRDVPLWLITGESWGRA